MSEIHPFHQDNPYPERKWVGLSVLFLVLYLVATRLILNQRELPEPFDAAVAILIQLPILIGGWHALGRLSYPILWRIGLFIPGLGFLAAIVILMLSARQARKLRSHVSSEADG